MKKIHTSRILLLTTVLGLGLAGAIYAFTTKEKAIDNQGVVSTSQIYSVPALLQREKNLSEDEFRKIEEKYFKLLEKYNTDNEDFKSLLKIVEIYIFEARVTGEHPYYYHAALVTLDEILKHRSQLSEDDLFTTLFYKSTVELSQHKFREALATSKEALKVNDMNSGIYGSMVDANVEIGNYQEAVQDADKMNQLRPDLRSYSRISYVREIYGDLKGSIAAMKMAIEAGAPYSEYKCWTIVTLGKIYEEHNMADSAALCYKMALTERPNYPFAIAGEASLEARKGNYTEALAKYNEALTYLPEISFNIAKAKIYQHIGQTAELQKLLPEIDKMFKEDIESGHNMGLEYSVYLSELKHDYPNALKYALTELKDRPNNIDVNRQLAYVYYAMGDNAKASTHVKIAMRTGKKDADLWTISGLINNDRAQLKKSFQLDPQQDNLFAEKAKSLINS